MRLNFWPCFYHKIICLRLFLRLTWPVFDILRNFCCWQRDTFVQLLLHSAIKSSNPDHKVLARTLLNQRKSERVADPLGDRLLTLLDSKSGWIRNPLDTNLLVYTVLYKTADIIGDCIRSWKWHLRMFIEKYRQLHGSPSHSEDISDVYLYIIYLLYLRNYIWTVSSGSS